MPIIFPPATGAVFPMLNRDQYTITPWTDPDTDLQWLFTVFPGDTGRWSAVVDAGGGAADDAAYGPSWNGVVDVAPSKNAVFDKFESLVPPDALVFAGSDPNIPETLTVVGIDDPADTDPLILARGSSYNDYPTWGVSLFMRWEPAYGGTWQLSDGFSFDAVNYSAASTPVGLTGWTVGPGAGVIVVTGDAPLPATFLGQRCLTPNGWWTWNGSLWVADAAGGSTADDTEYGPSWNGVTTTPPSKNALFDKFESLSPADTAPVNGAAATAIINPAGADNSILYTADEVGTAGNSISLAYATPAAAATTTVGVADNAITVTPGTKARMAVTGTLVDYVGAPIEIPELAYAGDLNSRPKYQLGADVNAWWIRWESSKWRIGGTYLNGGLWESSENVATPDLVITWTQVGSATGTPTVAAGTSSAAQVLAAVNNSGAAAALVTASASGIVTGPVAAVATTTLAGGVAGTIAPPYIRVAGGFLYIQEAGVWKKAALSAI